MTMEEIADRSVIINRDMRIALHEILDAAEGLGQPARNNLVPKIKKALEASAEMPTAYDINKAKTEK